MYIYFQIKDEDYLKKDEHKSSSHSIVKSDHHKHALADKANKHSKYGNLHHANSLSKKVGE